MAEFDIHSVLDTRSALNPTNTTATAAVNGEIIDTRGFEAVEFAVQAGTLGATLAVTVQDGDASDLSDAANVDSALVLNALPSFAATDDNAVKRFGYIGKKRYVRVTVTPGGTASCDFSAVAVLGKPHSAPVAD